MKRGVTINKIFNQSKLMIIMGVIVMMLIPSTAKAQSIGSFSIDIPQRAVKQKIVVEKPDLEKIKNETLDPKSKYYFPKLVKKFGENDTVMTNEMYRYLYFGYMFQEDYDPYRTSQYSVDLNEFRSKANYTEEELDTLRVRVEKSLNDNPFDLQQMSLLVYIYKKKNKRMTSKIWEYRLENLLAAIKSTGTGEDIDNAWYVITPAHEYDMVRMLGYQAVDAEFIEPGYDYLIVEPDEDTRTKLRNKVAPGFYFNVIVPQEQYEMKHPELWREEPEL